MTLRRALKYVFFIIKLVYLDERELHEAELCKPVIISLAMVCCRKRTLTTEAEFLTREYRVLSGVRRFSDSRRNVNIPGRRFA